MTRPAAIAAFTRWPGLLRLAIDVVGGPIVALINLQAIYAGDTWACGHNTEWSLHIAPALCLVVVVGMTIDSWLIYHAVGGGVEDELGAEVTRTRFFALLGIMIGAISAAVILAQWLAIFTFSACMRA